MEKHRLMRMLDILFALAMFQIIFENIGIPYTRTLEGFRTMRRDVFRALASLLWLLGLWLGGYRAWDGARRLSRGALLSGAGLMLCLLAAPWATQLIVISYKALISQMIYGGCMLLSAAFCWLMSWQLGRANDGDAACAGHGRVLLGAAGILAAGAVLTVVWARQAMWYSVAIAGMYLLVMAAIQRYGDGGDPEV